MTTATPRLTICPRCQREFRLRADVAGKKVKCECGSVFVVAPVQVTPIGADDLIEPPAPPQLPLVAANASPLPSSAPRIYSPVAQALLEREDDSQISRFHEVWLPATMLIIGFAIHLFLWSCWLDTPLRIATAAGISVAVQLLFFSPVMFGSLLLGARWLDVQLGSLRSIAWKIIALTMGPAAIADVLFTVVLILANFDWEMIVGGFGFYLVLYGICMAILFELNVAQTASLVAFNFMARAAAAFPAAIVLSNIHWIR